MAKAFIARGGPVQPVDQHPVGALGAITGAATTPPPRY